MKKFALLFVASLLFVACKGDKEIDETILKGKISIVVDEEVFPIVEDAYWVFRTQYPAEIDLDSLPESETVNELLKGTADVAVLSRKLTAPEERKFTSKGIKPRVTPFAKDAVVFITHASSPDSIIDLQDVVALLQGKSSRIDRLVFENPNSGTVRYMDSVAGVKKGPKKGVYSLDSHQSVLKYIAKNPGAIAVVGLNPILQPYPEWEKSTSEVRVMAVRNVKKGNQDVSAYKPNQSNIAEGKYPLTRTLYVLNYQGSAGLGTGFASYIAGHDGQRIILKSGLLPIRIPARTISVRKEINNTK